MHKELTFIGLGRMGAAMAANLVEQGYTIHGFDVNKDARIAAAATGVTIHESLEAAVGALDAPRTVWLMLPAQFVDATLAQLRPLLSRDDTIIDGGNSFFKDTIHRQNDLAGDLIHYIDCGTSGGVSGARNGASLMVGGEKKIVERHKHIFTALATENGYGHVGGSGAGHFVKMVHNGIEYGMMGAIAEGINVLHHHKEGLELDINETLKPYQHGSIIESNLMNWISDAYHLDGYLEKIAGEVPLGETEMEMEYLIEHEDVRILDAAVLQRKLTRLKPSFIGTLISAMRNQFGGHKILDKDTNATK
ncbi:MAG: 6-phosphogluconate dehydrogenase [Patiriisocius sp.]|jgi:6-phosphogluconate dehydrogenase